MKEINTKTKKKFSILFLVPIFFIFFYTVGQFIPVYFIDSNLRMRFYIFIFILLVVSVIWTIFKIVYNPKEGNIVKASVASLLIGFISFFIFGFWTIILFLGVWAEAATYYVKKSNPQVKIISRYVNEGAFGGGTEPGDYHMVVHRPFLFLFKIETSVDTISIDKNEWIKSN